MRFKEMEKLIYEFACELSRDITIKILENMDNDIVNNSWHFFLKHFGIYAATAKES